MKDQTSPPDKPGDPSLSVLMLIQCPWRFTGRDQLQLLKIARLAVVKELIMVGKQLPKLSFQLEKEAKLRFFKLDSESLPLQAEAGAFEACADILVYLQQGVKLKEHFLLQVPLAVAEGFQFGGLIISRNRCWAHVLKVSCTLCKGLFWFRKSQGYFVSRKVFHQSGGFKHNGQLIPFLELLSKQQKLSSYTFLFWP